MSQPLLCNIDWLGVSLELHDVVGAAPSGYFWQLYDGTNVWRERRILYTDDGHRVLTLLSSPKSSLLKGRPALVEVENEWLYHGIGETNLMSLLWQCVPFTIRGLSRIDLCVDFEPNERQAEIIERLATGEYYVGGKRNGSGFWSINSPNVMHELVATEEGAKVVKINPEYTNLHPFWVGRRIPHSISWGHKTSDVKWKLYYKTKELIDAAGGHGFDKSYIVDQWRADGLDVTNVWRLEVSLHNCNRFRFDGHHISFEELRKDAHDMFKSLYNQRFQVRENQCHKDKSNDRIVDFLPVGECSHVFRCHVAEPLTKRNGRVSLLRKLIASLEEPAVLFDEATRENVLWMVEQLVNNDGLDGWFYLATGMYVADFVEDTRVRAYAHSVS